METTYDVEPVVEEGRVLMLVVDLMKTLTPSFVLLCLKFTALTIAHGCLQ